MPKISFSFASQRNKPLAVDDRVKSYILTGNRQGIIRNERNIKITSNRFKVDAAPDRYTLGIEIDGFQDRTVSFSITTETRGDIRITLPHRCVDLPEFDELNPTPRDLLRSFAPEVEPQQTWQTLSDNQCATFFQITHALTRRGLANGRSLASYINRVRVIGGVEITGTLPDEREKTAVGWRMHVVINKEDRKRIEDDLVAGGIFGDKDPETNKIHAKFGLTKSYREKGQEPRIQIVLDDHNVHADLDLDVTVFHRPAPHEVFKKFIKKFPEVSGIY